MERVASKNEQSAKPNSEVSGGESVMKGTGENVTWISSAAESLKAMGKTVVSKVGSTQPVKDGALGAVSALGIQQMANFAIPYATGQFGTVVSGVGTLHAAGGESVMKGTGENVTWISSAAESLQATGKTVVSKVGSSQPVKDGALGAVSALGIQQMANFAIPYAMSQFGTVVSGVGTLHAAGGVAATCQMIAASPSLPFAVAGGVVFIAGKAVYTNYHSTTPPSTPMSKM